MGTWGCLTFENDTASDWLSDLEEAKDSQFLLSPIRAVIAARNKPDLDDCLESLAAAEVIAGARHEPPQCVPMSAKKWICRTGFSPSDSIVKLARRAVGKVCKNSELSDLWGAAGKLVPWQKAVEELDGRLVLALGIKPPERLRKARVQRQTLAEFIIEVAAHPTQEKREELCAKLAKLSDPNRPVGGRGLNSMTPLHWVAAHGLLEEAKLLISRGAVVDAKISCLARPIGFAVENRHYAMVDCLVSAGADKAYALLNAVQSDEVGIAEKLVGLGADLHYRNEGQCTLIHFAVRAGAIKSVKWLLGQGLDVNARDSTGETPLYDAIVNNSLAMVKVLVAGGAIIRIKNKEGKTPLDLAKLEFVHGAIGRFLRQQAAS